MLSKVTVENPAIYCKVASGNKGALKFCESFGRGKFSFFSYQESNLSLTLSWRKPLSYRNQSIDLLCKSMDWFLYDNNLRHERVNYKRSHGITVLINLFPLPIRSKCIFLEQNCFNLERKSQTSVVTSLYCLLFSPIKKRPKTDLKNYQQCSVSIEISFDF